MIRSVLWIQFRTVELQANDETNDDASSQANDPDEQTAQAKLRDLKPEKDPMGAGNYPAQDSSTTR